MVSLRANSHSSAHLKLPFPFQTTALRSCRNGSLTVADEKSGKFDVEQVVKTPEGARTMGVNEASKPIYLPTAELEPATTGKPKPKPRTFIIVVVGRQ